MSKLDGIKPGDRVRVTFEGEVMEAVDVDGDMLIRWDGMSSNDFVFGSSASAPTFQIERIEPPIVVGDYVFDPPAGNCATVIAIVERNGSRWLWLDGGPGGFRTRNENIVVRRADSERPF